MMMISNLADPPTKIPTIISSEDQQLIVQALLAYKKIWEFPFVNTKAEAFAADCTSLIALFNGMER